MAEQSGEGIEMLGDKQLHSVMLQLMAFAFAVSMISVVSAARRTGERTARGIACWLDGSPWLWEWRLSFS